MKYKQPTLFEDRPANAVVRKTVDDYFPSRNGTSAAPHDLQESLRASHAAEDYPLWEALYRNSFPGFRAMVNHREDGPHQRLGIDRSVILADSRQILIDEKIRGRNKKTNKVYDDIALEYWSDEARKTPGWVCKELHCDYIAYAIAPLGRAWLLPVIQLQRAWSQYSAIWIEKYKPVIRAPNRDRRTGREWVTISVGVPPDAVMRAIGACLRFNFEPFEIDG